MENTEVAYLGPPGTYSHLVAEKRFGSKHNYVSMSTILDVCSYVSRKRGRWGIIPIENSSGGAIHETIDILMANKPKVYITEELSLNVRLALIGQKEQKIQTLYSHFAPLEHCVAWIRSSLPKVRRCVVASTAAAAQRAASEDGGAALGSRRLAKLYDLDILHYPVQADIPNITSFLVITGRKVPVERPVKTTIAIRLPNKSGGLCTFLEILRNEDVNMSRLISRPIRGCPRQYAFLVDVEGGISMPSVKRALSVAKHVTDELRVVGSYPCRRQYNS